MEKPLKIKSLGVVRLYKINDIDTVVTPFNKEYTKWWYENEFGDEVNSMQQIILYKFDGIKIVPKFQDTDDMNSENILFWDYATEDEIKKLGDNHIVQPNVYRKGTIKNIYGDIYTLRSFYDVLPKYTMEMEEPEILCSSEF